MLGNIAYWNSPREMSQVFKAINNFSKGSLNEEGITTKYIEGLQNSYYADKIY